MFSTAPTFSVTAMLTAIVLFTLATMLAVQGLGPALICQPLPAHFQGCRHTFYYELNFLVSSNFSF